MSHGTNTAASPMRDTCVAYLEHRRFELPGLWVLVPEPFHYGLRTRSHAVAEAAVIPLDIVDLFDICLGEWNGADGLGKGLANAGGTFRRGPDGAEVADASDDSSSVQQLAIERERCHEPARPGPERRMGKSEELSVNVSQRHSMTGRSIVVKRLPRSLCQRY
jgi:hypothetical protein